MNLIEVSPLSEYKTNTTVGSHDILYLVDVFDRDILDLFSQNKPGYIVNDHFSKSEFQNVYCVPIFLWNTIKNCQKESLLIHDEITTEHPFNFVINKRIASRVFLLKLIQWFDLELANYYWLVPADNRFDMSKFIKEFKTLDEKLCHVKELSSFMLGENIIPPRTETSPSSEFRRLPINGFYPFWKKFLHPFMSKSAVSLITESVDFQKASVFTEKTLYSVFSMNFPIWIGGFNQATEWKKLGFDIFDDVIDHSYQRCESLTERCYRAIQDNIKILSDTKLAQHCREENKIRLLNNLKLLSTNGVENSIKSTMNEWPDDLQKTMIHRWKL
jgi:hypothetical protein